MNYKITEADISDSKNLADFNNKLFSEPNNFLIPFIDEFTVPLQKKFIQSFEKTKNAYIILGKLEGNIIGSLDFMPYSQFSRNHVGRLGIMVKKEYRQKGLASQLFKYLLDKLENSDILKIEGECLSTNKSIIQFNIKNNFEFEGLKRLAIKKNNDLLDLVLMSYKLK